MRTSGSESVDSMLVVGGELVSAFGVPSLCGVHVGRGWNDIESEGVSE